MLQRVRFQRSPRLTCQPDSVARPTAVQLVADGSATLSNRLPFEPDGFAEWTIFQVVPVMDSTSVTPMSDRGVGLEKPTAVQVVGDEQERPCPVSASTVASVLNYVTDEGLLKLFRGWSSTASSLLAQVSFGHAKDPQPGKHCLGNDRGGSFRRLRQHGWRVADDEPASHVHHCTAKLRPECSNRYPVLPTP
jgi:hypothetical protein